MPLAEMSPNIQDLGEAGRKRSHDDFSDDIVKISEEVSLKNHAGAALHPPEPLLPPMLAQLQSSPQGSPELTEAASSTPARMSPNPSTPSKEVASGLADKPSDSNTSKAQPAKKRKLTPAEREARDKEAAEKKKKKEEEDALKKKKKEEEEAAKAIRLKEREEQRKQKAQEKLDLQNQKDEKKRKIQAEKDKEARKQPKLASFFGAPATPKKTVVDKRASASPQKGCPAITSESADAAYRKLFKPFFVRENTHVAESATQMDLETREAKSLLLDQCIDQTKYTKEMYDEAAKDTSKKRTYDFTAALTLPCKPPQRGRHFQPVKYIMEDIYRSSGSSSTEEMNRLTMVARANLARVPMKVISFSQDVRPPYYGTMTLKQFDAGKNIMRRQAQSTTKKLLPLEYDYDSEAEWQEDEEGEDLDAEDDEEDLSDEDDMEGFLDDSEDLGPARAMAINALEPQCSGLQFEDMARNGCTEETHGFKMEMILGFEDAVSTVDPWSCSYWTPEPKKPAPEKAAPMPPPPVPVDAFDALRPSQKLNMQAAKLIKPEIMDDVKKSILANKSLSKVGIIDYIFQHFRDHVTRKEVIATIDMIAERKGNGKFKEWDLKEGHKIAS